jgi:hypothetical protein
MFILTFEVAGLPRNLAGGNFYYEQNCGLWIIVMLEMTVYGLKSPESTSTFCFIPYPIKSTWMPWIFFGLFSVMRSQSCFDILAGILLGYVHMKTNALNWTVVGDERTARVEKWCLFSWVKVFGNYITLENSTGDEIIGESS